MDYLSLSAHPEHAPLAVTAIEAASWHDGECWRFRYMLDGTSKLVLPDPAPGGRVDNLWRRSCFEAFVGGAGSDYFEYNFSPSGQWAAYAFEGPRQGMRDADAEVEVWLEGGDDWIAVEAAVSADFAPGSLLSLTAAIEEEGGVQSYWALAHPDAPPDFHNRDCFVAHLPSGKAP